MMRALPGDLAFRIAAGRHGYDNTTAEAAAQVRDELALDRSPFFAFLDWIGDIARFDLGRVMGSAMWFPHGEQFATLGMTITFPRLQTNGTAKWLLQRVLAECRGRTFRLNVTRAAQRLCHSMGFVVQQTVFQCQGDAVKPAEAAPVSGYTLRRLERSDLEAVVAFDAQAFAVPRPVHLARLFETAICYGLFQDDRLYAYSTSRSFGRGHVVGPIVASCEGDAVTVARPHFVAHAGGFLRVDTHFDTGVFASFIQE